jgi:multidrug/hemolysin transport system permease protein
MISRLVLRHITLYVRARWAVFFSFLSVLIILGLFMLFLRDSFGGDFGELPYADYVIHTWIFSGVLMVSTVTVPLGFYVVMIRDIELKTINDFYVAPIKRRNIVISYFIAALLIGSIFGLFNLVVGQLYIGFKFGLFLDFFTLLKLVLLVIFSSSLFSSLFFLALTYIKSSDAHGTLGTLIGTLIGFLTGLYIPIGVLGNTMRNILSLLPTMQMVSIFRIVYMEDSLDKAFVGAGAFRIQMESFLGVSLELFNQVISPWLTMIILIIWTIIFLTLSIMRLNAFKR